MPEHCISISTYDTIKPKKPYFVIFFIKKGQFESYKLSLEYPTDTKLICHPQTSSYLTEINSTVHLTHLQTQVKNKLRLTFSTLQEADNEQKPKTLHSAARRHHY